MKKLYLLLAIILIFSGGFIAGSFFSMKNSSSIPKTISLNPPSSKELEQKAAPKLEQIASKLLIGYVQDFRDPSVVNYSQLTHVIFSFAHPTKDGRLLFNGDTALNNLRAMVTKAHQNKTKAILAIGGWFHINGGESYDYFKSAIASPDARTKLVNELMNLVATENLDGIDIDFEHPRSKKDAEDLNAFTQELSSKLHPQGKELSIAVHSKIHSVTGTELGFVVYEPTMFQYVDHVNIMAYDGQWDGGYNAANLSPYPFTENIVNYWTALFDRHNLSKEKLVLGVPFYAQPEDPNSKQVSYEALINNNPDNAGRDSVSLNGTTYHYNGEKTIQRKTKLALDHGFGGMMMWEVGLDAKDAYSLTAAISEEMKEIK
ncbi:glycosyl hydrolase family 18 protein [Cytobacillus solani]|uniref:chitinase n=1 Tax=Cytobacillus solani TaxID=1637975 RepID=A0A0Q3VHU3_9BACI|nr:glycosyl hydrolase family 18 protein [Cytobacillus solani]KOP82508.1 chitinase [Bacillus sp. FJAT-21945]KQL19519.1 chitinase [Cytobacillus solani]